MEEESSSANNGNGNTDAANITVGNNTGGSKIYIYKGDNNNEEEVPMDIQHLIIHNSVIDIPDRTFLGRTALCTVQFYDHADSNNSNAADNNAADNGGNHIAMEDAENIADINNNNRAKSSNLRTIGAYAFGDCTSLHSLSIPKNVSIGEYGFAGCTSLSFVEFVSLNNNNGNNDDGNNNGDNVDGDNNGEGYNGDEEDDEMMEIGTMAFYRCTALSNINFPGVATTSAAAGTNDYYDDYYDASPGSNSKSTTNKNSNNNFTLENTNIIGSSKDLTIWKRSYQRNRMLLLILSSILVVVVILGVVIGVVISSPSGNGGGGGDNGSSIGNSPGTIVDPSSSNNNGDNSNPTAVVPPTDESTTSTITKEEEIEYCILVNVTLDKYPTDTSWKIEDTTSNQITIATSSPYLESMAYSTVDEQQVCFLSSSSGGKQEYSFAIFDEYGDGLCCSWGEGRYTVSTMNGLIIASGGEFEYEERTTFTIPFTDSNGQQQQPQQSAAPPATTGGSTPTTAATTTTTTPPPVSLSSTCITIEISITLDKYPLDTTWNIINSVSGEMVVTSTSYDESLAGTTQIDTICLLNGEYTFTIFDVFEDGMCCKWGDGGYILRYLSSGNEIISGGEWVGASETRSFSINDEEEAKQQQQPMSPAVTLPPTAPPTTQEPTLRPTPKPSTLPPTLNPTTSAPTPPRTATASTCTTIDVSITLDKYPLDTSWEVLDSTTGDILATSPPYDETLAESTQVTRICLPPGLYSFVIYDVYEDGICCSWGAGSYTLLSSSGEILVTGSEWIGPSEMKVFTISSERQA
jgi:hypothetical protein